MSSHWTDIDEIMRDLSLAQGRNVPADVNGTLAGHRPPINNCPEETEEGFFKKFAGAGDFEEPDLQYIREMLEMVQTQDDSEEKNAEKGVQITKLNVQAPEFIPVSIEAGAGDSLAVVQNNCKKQLRNAAVESLLQAITDNIDPPKMERSQPIKLLRPEDFMKDETATKTLQKVKNWLQYQVVDERAEIEETGNTSNLNITIESTTPNSIETVHKDAEILSESPKARKTKPKDTKSPVKKEKYKPCITPMTTNSMFRSKNRSREVKPAEAPPKEEKIKMENDMILNEMAEEYYQQFLKQVELREISEESVWSKAERQMKELEAKQKTEPKDISSASSPATDTTSSAHSSTVDTKHNGIASIFLAEHRHTQPGPCVVCEVLCVKRTAIVPSAPPLDMFEADAAAVI